MGKAVLHRDEVRIGWTIGRTRERTGPQRCFKYLEPGHIAVNCKSLVDRSIRCGEQGHKAAKCSKEPSCFICSAEGKKDTRHQAGSRFCSATMMDKTARHITVATRETFVRMKALHASRSIGSTIHAPNTAEKRQSSQEHPLEPHKRATSKIVSPVIPVVGWEVIKKKPRTTRRV